MNSPLAERIAAVIACEVDPAVSAFAAHLAEHLPEHLPEQGDALAVLFYGSNLRTGSREGVLDFYILMPGPAETGIWPRVSYREWTFEGEVLRAKIATMTLTTFAAAARGETIDTTIWARFVQPSAIVWRRDDAVSGLVAQALSAASITAARLAAAVGPESGTEADYWRALFRATYKAELRVEKPGREDSILSLNPNHFDGLLPTAWDAAMLECTRAGDLLTPALAVSERRTILNWWRKRRRLGKPLNIVRLVRATRTFDGAARYAAWKVHRHTGVEVEVTPWREKHPLLSAPGVMFKVWRAKKARGAKPSS